MSRLVVKKRQSKTTSHPLGSPEWKNKKSTSNKCQQRCGEIGTIKRCYQDRQVVQSLWKTVWQFPKHLNIKLLDDPVILLLPERNIPDKWKHSHTKMCIEIYSSIIHSSQKVETIQMDEKINKMCYIHKEYHAVTKKDGVVIHVTDKTWKHSVQSLSCVRLFATPWITACQASLSLSKSRSLL